MGELFLCDPLSVSDCHCCLVASTYLADFSVLASQVQADEVVGPVFPRRGAQDSVRLQERRRHRDNPAELQNGRDSSRNTSEKAVLALR